MRKSNISILVTWSTQRRNFSSLGWWRTDVMIELCMCRTCSIVQIKIVQAAWHSWRWTRSRVLGQESVTADSEGECDPTSDLLSPVCPPLHPPSDRAVMSWTSTCCFSISDMWAPRCVTPGCDGRVWRKVWPNLWSLFSPSLAPCPSPAHAAQHSSMLFVLQTVELETKLHEVWSFTITEKAPTRANWLKAPRSALHLLSYLRSFVSSSNRQSDRDRGGGKGGGKYLSIKSGDRDGEWNGRIVCKESPCLFARLRSGQESPCSELMDFCNFATIFIKMEKDNYSLID